MRQKPRLLLLDAGAVIGAFACGGWEALCDAYHIVVPATVIGEALYYIDATGRQQSIDLAPYIATDRIERYEASALELAVTISTLHPYIRDRIHRGELEALTYLRLQPDKTGIAFISTDGVAIQATHAFDAADCALSLDAVLRKCGITKELHHMYCDAFVAKHRQQGEILFLQGLLVSGPQRPGG